MVTIGIITAVIASLIIGVYYVVKSTINDINLYFDNDDDDIEYFG
jgi:hypothetical protein